MEFTGDTERVQAYTPAQVAELLDLKPRQLKRMLREGRLDLPHIGSGKSLRFAPGPVLRFLEGEGETA